MHEKSHTFTDFDLFDWIFTSFSSSLSTPHSFSKIEVENFSIWLFIHLWMNMCEFVERTWMGWDLRWRCRNSAEEEKTFSLRCCGVKENFNRAYIERRKIQLRTIERKMKWKDFYSAKRRERGRERRRDKETHTSNGKVLMIELNFLSITSQSAI